MARFHHFNGGAGEKVHTVFAALGAARSEMLSARIAAPARQHRAFNAGQNCKPSKQADVDARVDFSLSKLSCPSRVERRGLCLHPRTSPTAPKEQETSARRDEALDGVRTITFSTLIDEPTSSHALIRNPVCKSTCLHGQPAGRSSSGVGARDVLRGMAPLESRCSCSPYSTTVLAIASERPTRMNCKPAISRLPRYDQLRPRRTSDTRLQSGSRRLTATDPDRDVAGAGAANGQPDHATDQNAAPDPTKTIVLSAPIDMGDAEATDSATSNGDNGPVSHPTHLHRTHPWKHYVSCSQLRAATGGHRLGWHRCGAWHRLAGTIPCVFREVGQRLPFYRAAVPAKFTATETPAPVAPCRLSAKTCLNDDPACCPMTNKFNPRPLQGNAGRLGHTVMLPTAAKRDRPRRQRHRFDRPILMDIPCGDQRISNTGDFCKGEAPMPNTPIIGPSPAHACPMNAPPLRPRQTAFWQKPSTPRP